MFRNYPNDRLLEELRSTYGDERASVVKVIRLLEEVDRRRLYAELGYSSLFRFCQKVLNTAADHARPGSTSISPATLWLFAPEPSAYGR